MTDLIKRALIIFSIVITGGVASASAQLDVGSAITADIPMSFTVKGKSFPAGRYKISRVISPTPSSALVLRNRMGDAIILNTNASDMGREARRTQLIFDLVGGGYMLSSITVTGQARSYEVPKTRAQRDAIAHRRSVRVVTADAGP
jgi:hypothetical protein